MKRGDEPAGSSAAGAPAPRPLPRRFFNRSPVLVAQDLLGQLLVRALPEGLVCARIVEVEAYLGENDPAAHAARGLTPRNAVLFGPPGRAYVYFSYGLHYCLNVATLPAGRAGGVLLRALELWHAPRALAVAVAQRAPATNPVRLLSGPGRLTRALAIDGQWNGHDLTVRGALYLAAGARPERIVATPRIGISKAADLPLRFYVWGSPAISGRKGRALQVLAYRDGQWRASGATAQGPGRRVDFAGISDAKPAH